MAMPSKEAIKKAFETKGVDYGVGGSLGAVTYMINREVEEHVAPYGQFMERIHHFSNGVVSTLLGIIGIVTGVPYLDTLTVVGVKELLSGVYKQFIKKDPYLVVTADSIEGYNFDPSEDVILVVDGEKVSPTSNVTVKTDGDGYFIYKPSTKLSKGVHTVVASTSTKSAYGRFPV